MIFSAPFTPTEAYLRAIPIGLPHVVYHGPTAFMPLTYDPYVDPMRMGIYQEIGDHQFQDVNAGQIVRRILKSREAFEERQRAKGQKGIGEDALKLREEMEQDALQLERERAAQ